MGFLALLACAALAAPQESAAEAADVAVTVPAALPSAPPAPPPQAAAESLPPAAPSARAAEDRPVPAIPAQDLPRSGRLLEDRPESGPGIGGFVAGSLAVVGLLGGALLLLRRFGRGSRLLGAGGPIRVLARKPLGPKQDVFLVEIGTRVFVIGSTREQLSALGEFSGSDEVAALRAGVSARGEDSPRQDFRETLREGLREHEAPRDDRVFASIADELAEIRKTVRAWRA
jgi:flagellar biogenesis protein FliO